jgi:hypothetical protein
MGFLLARRNNRKKIKATSDAKNKCNNNYLSFGSIKDSIKLRCLSLRSQEAGIATDCSAAGASFALHAGVFGCRAVTGYLRLSEFAHMA